MKENAGTDLGHGESGREVVAGEWLSAMVQSSDDAILTKDLAGVITSWNKGAERLFGYTASEIIGKPLSILVPADRQDEELSILARIRRGERVGHYDTVRRRKDGSLVEISLTVSPIKDVKGQVIGASKIARDITERKRLEERQTLLLREMSHRIRNLFTVASSLVALSTPEASTPEALAQIVQERLSALARAHELTLTNPTGVALPGTRPTTLHALTKTILSPFMYQKGADERVSVAGPDVLVGEASVTALALLLHELAINAAKYGSLSARAGRIAIECRQEGGRFFLDWQEQGGPRVTQEGEGEGFGGLLVRAAVRHQLGGEITREWRPEGLIIHLAFAAERLST